MGIISEMGAGARPECDESPIGSGFIPRGVYAISLHRHIHTHASFFREQSIRPFRRCLARNARRSNSYKYTFVCASACSGGGFLPVPYSLGHRCKRAREKKLERKPELCVCVCVCTTRHTMKIDVRLLAFRFVHARKGFSGRRRRRRSWSYPFNNIYYSRQKT